MTTNVPRKHHYVPKLLLRGFTTSGANDGALHVIDLLRRTTYTSTPDGTGKETDYNLVDAPDVDPFVVERDILANTVEGPAATGIEAMRRGEVPDEKDRQAVLNFVAMQALRAPSRRVAFDAFSTQLARIATTLMIDDEATFEAMKRSDPDLVDLTREERGARDCAEPRRAKHDDRAPRCDSSCLRTALRFVGATELGLA